jgi:hypothetical protein
LPLSERSEIQQRIKNFKTHQEEIAREREAYYLQIKARMMKDAAFVRSEESPELAERYGYINRALPAEELTPFVEKLAHRIASFPAHAIAHAKAAVDTGAFSSMAEGLLVEAHESDLSVASEVTCTHGSGRGAVSNDRPYRTSHWSFSGFDPGVDIVPTRAGQDQFSCISVGG